MHSLALLLWSMGLAHGSMKSWHRTCLSMVCAEIISKVLRGSESLWPMLKFVHDKDHSIRFKWFGIVFVTVLHHLRQSRDSVWERKF
jgi:hypothetical protein